MMILMVVPPLLAGEAASVAALPGAQGPEGGSTEGVRAGRRGRHGAGYVRALTPSHVLYFII